MSLVKRSCGGLLLMGYWIVVELLLLCVLVVSCCGDGGSVCSNCQTLQYDSFFVLVEVYLV